MGRGDARLDGPRYIGKPLLRSAGCRFFISSGSDVSDQRDLFDRLVRALSEQFRDWDEGRFHLEVDRWEQDAPRRADGRPNDEFVRRAVDAHCTVVLLATEVRAGTREELEAVLGSSTTQLAVLHMKTPKKYLRDRTLREFLEGHRNDFLYDVTGPPGSPEAILSMVRVIARTLADVTNPTRKEDLFYEDRR